MSNNDILLRELKEGYERERAELLRMASLESTVAQAIVKKT